MNCFQKFVSLIFWTTKIHWISSWIWLWIAFKSLYLWYSEQRRATLNLRLISCELLSKVCIFDILNNAKLGDSHNRSVVNCFQKFVSLIFWTTSFAAGMSPRPLWIAFKSLYLWYSEQQQGQRVSPKQCCELLSKVCIFDILNNRDIFLITAYIVVNCFQKFVSLIFWTTFRCVNIFIWVLWIAFKSLYLWYSEQLKTERTYLRYSCELLSKVCIFDILNNIVIQYKLGECVVNCFQKFVSLIFWTTSRGGFFLNNMLWIAFKFLYLWLLKQPQTYVDAWLKGCELLSESHTIFLQKIRINKN